MTAPGETVVRGQELVRLLDCSGLVVTATVGEAAYNRLRVGQPARFRFRGESTDHEGRIIGLTGVATAPANLAIQPAALAKEPYRVTVAVPDWASGPLQRRPHRPRHVRRVMDPGTMPPAAREPRARLPGPRRRAGSCCPGCAKRRARPRGHGGRHDRADVALHGVALDRDAAAVGLSARFRRSACVRVGRNLAMRRQHHQPRLPGAPQRPLARCRTATPPGLRRAAPPPLVDVFICTYNEEQAILERTIIGALSLDYPRYRVWVLDDGRRPWLQTLQRASARAT